MFLSKNLKIISFTSENFQFSEMKFSIYLTRRVFIMNANTSQPLYNTIVGVHSINRVN